MVSFIYSYRISFDIQWYCFDYYFNKTLYLHVIWKCARYVSEYLKTKPENYSQSQTLANGRFTLSILLSISSIKCKIFSWRSSLFYIDILEDFMQNYIDALLVVYPPTAKFSPSSSDIINQKFYVTRLMFYYTKINLLSFDRQHLNKRFWFILLIFKVRIEILTSFD